MNSTIENCWKVSSELTIPFKSWPEEEFETKEFDVGLPIATGYVDDDNVLPTVIYRGWFSHNERGLEYGGELTFHGLKLTDYIGNGIGDHLPKEVLDGLEARGFDVTAMRPE